MEISRGFTLVELMIVILIIGVLIAIAIPIYQYYVSKSQVVAAIAELNGAKPQYELLLMEHPLLAVIILLSQICFFLELSQIFVSIVLIHLIVLVMLMGH